MAFRYWLTGALIFVVLLGGCSAEPEEQAVLLAIPRGYMPVLEIEQGGSLYTFGPFVGYYFRPESSDSFQRLRFVCFNERQFYTRDLAANVLLFEGDAVLTRLPRSDTPIPATPNRIQPVFEKEIPPAWVASRPEPQEEFVHFHSCYNQGGAVLLGYWLRHSAKHKFTYDMGNRVGPDSPLYHEVTPGVDRDFAFIVEFDQGPTPEPRE